MLMAEPSTYDMFAFLKKNGYVFVSKYANINWTNVDGSAVNIQQVLKLSYVDS